MADETEQNQLPTQTIIIDRRSPVGVDAEVNICVNGVTQTVPVGQPVDVREDMLEAIQNSDRTFTVVDTGEGAAGVSLAGGTAAAGDTTMDGDAQHDPAGGRDGANDRLAPHVDKDSTGFQYAPDPGAFGATGEEGKPAVPEGALTAEQQGEMNGTDGGSDELGGEMDKAQQGGNVIQDGEVKKRAEPETAETSAKEAPAPEPEAKAFDADAVIGGNIAAVKARLVGLTADELDQVAAAEKDREVPRSGVAAAIEEAKANLAS